MLIYVLLLVPVILPSIHAFKRENLNVSDTINTDESYVHNKDQRVFLQKNEKKDIDSRHAEGVIILERQVITDGSKKELGHIQRPKRQWNAIFAGVSAGMNLVGLGLTLAQTISGGCMYFPSICKNKKRMEDLERRLVHMRAEYNKLYLHNKKEFLNLITANSNNAYILYYINDTIRQSISLQEHESRLSALLELKIPKIHEKYENAQNVTSKEYLNNVLGGLTYRVADINEMIADQKKTMYIGVIVQCAFGAAFKVASFAISKINQRIAVNQKLFDMVRLYGVPVPTGRTSKLVRHSLKMSEMQTRAALEHMVIQGKAEAKANRNFSKRPSNAQIAMGVFGLIGEIVAQVIYVWQWKGTADKIEKARINYENYYRKFHKELNKVKNEQIVLDQRWSEVIQRFNGSTSIFKNLIESARNNTQFNATVGRPQLPINTSNPIFDIDFKTLDRSTVQSAQNRVLNFLKAIANNVTVLNNRMYARIILYETVLNYTDSNQTIDYIFSTIIYKMSFETLPKTIQEYARSLTEKDIVCTISLLRRDLEYYDYFPLVVFRPICNLSIDEYKKNSQIANTKRYKKLMTDTIFQKLNSNKSSLALVDLTDYIKQVYSVKGNSEMSRYGDKITEKDVICSIAKQFPYKQEYDFISLAPFRSDCGKVDEDTFNKIKKAAEKTKNAHLNIKNLVFVCETSPVCICPSMIGQVFGIPQKDVIDIIRLYANPLLDKYCGTTSACECVKLN